MSSSPFPQFQYNSLYRYQLSHQAPFIVIAMFTSHHAKYLQYADRFADSCEKFKLEYIIYDIEGIHTSISLSGTDDPNHTKASLINFVIDSYAKPVLYVDIDCYFEAFPDIILQCIHRQVDFAIYNWLSDPITDAYIPVTVKVPQEDTMIEVKDQYYKYSHAVNYYSDQQLLCSGCTKYFNTSNASLYLLKCWQETMIQFPISVDDQSLDYAFNNKILDKVPIQTYWLPKSYARYPWWIYEKPVINHPDTPISREDYLPHQGANGKKSVYFERLETPAHEPVFPYNALINVQNKTLYLIDSTGTRVEKEEQFFQDIWI